MVGEYRNSDAAADIEDNVTNGEGLLNFFEKDVCETLHLGLAIHLRQQQGKLVAAEAREGDMLRHLPASREARLLQQLIADGMAQRIVNFFKSIEIEEKDGQNAPWHCASRRSRKVSRELCAV